ncbi:hypothetical protein DPEC_G00283830 [Dallia pectoralis]|uniref:Uncharacterized protein n=1 Tax=Dallia pectoralis TaxID=75939 RepID=A0ACC2FJA6_DALPE|nr:hypothetical protein DPEC_G00283830 [Dallia pectoralis]
MILTYAPLSSLRLTESDACRRQKKQPVRPQTARECHGLRTNYRVAKRSIWPVLPGVRRWEEKTRTRNSTESADEYTRAAKSIQQIVLRQRRHGRIVEESRREDMKVIAIGENVLEINGTRRNRTGSKGVSVGEDQMREFNTAWLTTPVMAALSHQLFHTAEAALSAINHSDSTIRDLSLTLPAIPGPSLSVLQSQLKVIRTWASPGPSAVPSHYQCTFARTPASRPLNPGGPRCPPSARQEPKVTPDSGFRHTEGV